MDRHLDQAAQAEFLASQGRWLEAAAAYANVILAGRSDYHVHYNYGTVLMNCDHYEGARDQLIASLLYFPKSIEALNNLSAAYFKLGNPCAAEETCRTILAHQPDFHLAWSNLGLSLASQGRVPDAIEAFQRALELVPNDRVAREGLLLNLNYIATNGLDLVDVHRLLCADLPSLSPKKPLPATSGRRIRIGYVSSDFKSHPVSFFMAGIVLTHDRDAFEIFCYSSTHAPDGRTEDFRRLAEHFVDLANCSDAEGAIRIEADQIDILVDLGGHTSGNRLGIFALRPAPVQVSYLGYPATTGCAFIDYRVVDILTDPAGSEAYSTERLARVPAPFLCYYPHTTYPESGPLPALTNGHITFGSFNHSPKISADTLDLWSCVLKEVPDSRMFIKARAFSEAAVCERFREQFAIRGIEPSRLIFSGLLEAAQDHLATYGRVDIALDTFPYNGTTTTCEALWMGVPVISLVGDLHAARVGFTLLNAVGLGGLATTSGDNYVALAAALSKDKGHLTHLRGHLQQVIANSPLCDRFRLTKGLEDTYRKMLEP
jgi:tetratricopeptide (TPR) repeat protein